MRCVELFAGAGGAALGLECAGIHHAALVEWDAAACATLRTAGLGPVVEGDVRDLDAITEAVGGEAVDVLWSSFPCQAFSTAGKRLGANDERNGWPWTIKATDRFKPAWLLGENVRGLLLHRGGCTAAGGQEGLFGTAPAADCPGCYFERVILPDLRARFACVGWWLLDAADYGVPQHRRRVILWAGPRPLVEPTPTHGPGRARPWVSMGEALGSLLDSEQSWSVMAAGVTGEGRPRSSSDPAPAIGTKGTAYLCRPAPTVTATEVKGTRGDGQSGGPDRASDALYLATGRRRLTVEECATLQGFPAAHPWQGTVEQRYRQVGNAVPPCLAEAIGRAVVTASEVAK